MVLVFTKILVTVFTLIIFISTTGSFFKSKYKHNKLLVSLSILIAIVSAFTTVHFIVDIAKTEIIEVLSTVKSNKEKPSFIEMKKEKIGQKHSTKPKVETRAKIESLLDIQVKEKVQEKRRAEFRGENNNLIKDRNQKETITLLSNGSIYRKVKRNYSLYSSTKLKLKAPDATGNGAIVPVTVDLNGEPKGKILLYVDVNNVPFAGSIEYHTDLSQNYLMTRLKMAKTGYIYAIFISNDGNIIANRKHVKVTVGSTPKEIDGVTIGSNIKVRAKNGRLKMVVRSRMGLSNYIERIDFLSKGDSIATIIATPNFSQNPYISIKYPSHIQNIQVLLKGVGGEQESTAIKTKL